MVAYSALLVVAAFTVSYGRNLFGNRVTSEVPNANSTPVARSRGDIDGTRIADQPSEVPMPDDPNKGEPADRKRVSQQKHEQAYQKRKAAGKSSKKK